MSETGYPIIVCDSCGDGLSIAEIAEGTPYCFRCAARMRREREQTGRGTKYTYRFTRNGTEWVITSANPLDPDTLRRLATEEPPGSPVSPGIRSSGRTRAQLIMDWIIVVGLVLIVVGVILAFYTR